MALHAVREKGNLRIEIHDDGTMALMRLRSPGTADEKIVNAVVLSSDDQEVLALARDDLLLMKYDQKRKCHCGICLPCRAAALRER